MNFNDLYYFRFSRSGIFDELSAFLFLEDIGYKKSVFDDQYENEIKYLEKAYLACKTNNDASNDCFINNVSCEALKGSLAKAVKEEDLSNKISRKEVDEISHFI